MLSLMNDDLTSAITADLGIGHLPPEEREKLLAQFGEVALKAATVSVLERLPEDKREAFGKLAEASDAAGLRAFLDREVPGHEAIAKGAVAEEARRFKEFQNA